MKANTHFFLSAVASHINAKIMVVDATTMITFTHQDDKAADCRLIVEVERKGNSFVIGYDMVKGSKVVSQAASVPLPSDVVQGVLAAIANDAFKQEKDLQSTIH